MHSAHLLDDYPAYTMLISQQYNVEPFAVFGEIFALKIESL